jgi:hypothetical protein
VLAAYLFDRDDGYFSSDRRKLESATYDDHLGGHRPPDRRDRMDPPDEILGDVRIRVEGKEPVFVGIGRDSDVARDELIDFDGDDPECERHEGGPPPTPPGEQGFWVAESEGSVEQTLMNGSRIGFSAANNCNEALSPRPSIVETTGGGRIWSG